MSMVTREISMMTAENVAGTLTATDYKGTQLICYDGQNCGTDSEKAYTLQAGRSDDHHIPDVVYPIENHAADSRVKLQDPKEPCQTLSARMGTGGGNVPMMLFDMQAIGQYGDSGTASTLKERDYKDATDLVVERKYIVRRLTPLECCRLQGFPDYWMDGVEGSDSAKYKMWGNGIALPCAADVLRRIAKNA